MWVNLKGQREYCIPEGPNRGKWNYARNLFFPSSNSFLLSGHSSALCTICLGQEWVWQGTSARGETAAPVFASTIRLIRGQEMEFIPAMQLRFNRAEPGILILCLWPSWGIHFQGCGISDTVVGTGLHSCEPYNTDISSLSGQRRDSVSSISPGLFGTNSRGKEGEMCTRKEKLWLMFRQNMPHNFIFH